MSFSCVAGWLLWDWSDRKLEILWEREDLIPSPKSISRGEILEVPTVHIKISIPAIYWKILLKKVRLTFVFILAFPIFLKTLTCEYGHKIEETFQKLQNNEK